MNDELKRLVWNLSKDLQTDLARFSDGDLTTLFRQAFSLQMLMQHVEAEPVEKQVVTDCLQRLTEEIHHRGIKITSLPVEVAISSDGKFVKGEDDLRRAFRIFTFEEMMDFIDAILANPLNEAQRKALLDLAREKVYADSTL